MKYQNKFIRKSHIKVYHDCPKLFDIKYYDILKKDNDEYSFALAIGTLFHDLAQFIVEENITDIKEIEHAITFKPLHDWIEWFIEENNKLNTSKDECEVELKSKTLLGGTVDRISVIDNNTVLFEYKTGSSNNLSNTKIDLAFYTILANQCGYQIDKWCYVNPRTKTFKIVDVDRKKIYQVNRYIKEIRTTSEFKPADKPKWCCYNCPINMKCPTFRDRIFNDEKIRTLFSKQVNVVESEYYAKKKYWQRL